MSQLEREILTFLQEAPHDAERPQGHLPAEIAAGVNCPFELAEHFVVQLEARGLVSLDARPNNSAAPVLTDIQITENGKQFLSNN